MTFDSGHLDVFLKIPLQDQGEVGVNLRRWAASLLPGLPIGTVERLPDKSVSRETLREFCLQNDSATAFLAVSAWGGMNRRHGSLAWQSQTDWLPDLNRIRWRGGTRAEDFASLHYLQVTKRFRGVGAPYFTKLLFFLRPTQDAYIMDQWTAKSVNILTGKQVVSLTRDGWVEPSNGSECYEEYCSLVDQLAILLRCGGGDAEQALMSEGKGVGEWRRYVVANYERLFPSQSLKRRPLVTLASHQIP